jgi:ABC-2 type transport system ATP-binding protein
MKHILRTYSIEKNYRKRLVLDKVNLNIKKGIIYWLLGKKDSGKTTLLKIICGLLKQSGGHLELFESNNLLIGRNRISYVMENLILYEHVTTFDNFNYFCCLIGIFDRGYLEDIMKFVGIWEYRNKQIKKLSPEMKQILIIGISLIGNPDFLIIDEPIVNLSPFGIKGIRELLIKLKVYKNITILISSRMNEEVYEIVDFIGIINNGKLVEEISKEEIENRCGRCLLINVNDIKKASYIIESKIKTSNYDVLDNNIIRLFGYTHNSYYINKIFLENNIEINSLTISRQSFENYFVKIIGDNV